MSHRQNDFDTSPPGFVMHEALVIDGRETARVELFLPTQFKHALDLQKKQEHEQRIADARARELREIENRKSDPKSEESLLQAHRSWSAPANSSAPPLLLPLVAGEDYDPRLMHPVYKPSAPAELFRKVALASADKDIRKRDEALAKKLTGTGILRKIAAPRDAVEALAALRQSQPHFGQVIDLVRDQILLAGRTSRGLRIPPILLNSEPGLGKTHFAIELAKALSTTVRRISFDNAISGATLMGSERRWGNTSYGVLFELVCLGENANPIVILDEIDKAETRREWDPLAPLHTLLEPSTATHARDISVDFEFDASLVTWIATSNYVERLLPSLRSRFREFHIQRPGAADAITSADAVIAKVFADMLLIDFEAPAKNMTVALAHLSAREIRQAMEQAIAHAVAHGRGRVTPDDLPAGLLEGGGTSGGGAGTSGKKNWLH